MLTKEQVRIENGLYSALILPEYGANCVSLVHRPTGTELLRVPETAQAMAEDPVVYGLPILLPPNRIRDGRFSFGGTEYRFPVNEPAGGNFVHGKLYRLPFLRLDTAEDPASCGFVYRATAEQPYYDFPHAFTVRRFYSLTEQGLTHRVTVTNDSGRPMPLGVGVHAALRLAPGQPYRLKIPAVCQWITDDARKLSTGETAEDTPFLRTVRGGTADPRNGPLSVQMECVPGAEIELSGPTGTLVCTPDPGMRFLMLWNGGGGRGFVCPEPQSWATDAPNLGDRAEKAGFRALGPGETADYVLHYSFCGRTDPA